MPHVNHLGPQTISSLAPLSGLIISIVLVIIFLIRFYVLQPLLPRVYGHYYTDMSTSNQRSFLNHHIAGSVKILILIIAVGVCLLIFVCTRTSSYYLMKDAPTVLEQTIYVYTDLGPAGLPFLVCRIWHEHVPQPHGTRCGTRLGRCNYG